MRVVRWRNLIGLLELKKCNSEPICCLVKAQRKELLHKRVVLVSTTISGNPTTVLTFVDKLLPEKQSPTPKLYTHSITDRFISQCMVKFIFNLVAHHKTLTNATQLELIGKCVMEM